LSTHYAPSLSRAPSCLPSPPSLSLLFFFFTLRPPPSSTLFPYTTLFRSQRWRRRRGGRAWRAVLQGERRSLCPGGGYAGRNCPHRRRPCPASAARRDGDRHLRY